MDMRGRVQGGQMIYDYKCDDCATSYEVERSMYATDVPPVCVACSKSMTRVWGVGSIRFEGTGFYSTDNPKR